MQTAMNCAAVTLPFVALSNSLARLMDGFRSPRRGLVSVLGLFLIRAASVEMFSPLSCRYCETGLVAASSMSRILPIWQRLASVFCLFGRG